jgi:redox-sensitive bicupin YhaK (pirin superfamily)
MGNFDSGVSTEYTIKKEGNGVYAFILKGNVTINGQELNTRDAVGISGTDILKIQANTDAEFLLMDIPMNY